MNSIYDFKVKNVKGQEVALSDYRGKALLVVNVASECGFTPQYEGLQKLYEEYKIKGLEILGFPCNQFGAQEPGTDADIQNFCSGRFGVRFPIFSKVEVNGPGAAPVFEYLKSQAPGLLGTKAIKWNFTKFLISKGGKVLKRFAPTDRPEDLKQDIEQALASAAG